MTNLLIPAGAEDPAFPISVPDEGEEVDAVGGFPGAIPPGKGPVRPGFHGLVMKLVCILRGFITFKSLYVDGTGEQAAVPGPGTIFATGAIGSASAMEAPLFAGAEVDTSLVHVVDTDGHCDVTGAHVAFSNLAPTGHKTGQCAPTEPLLNELRAVNVPKAWVRFTTDGAGNLTVVDGCNILAVSIGGLLGANVIRVFFAQPFNDGKYSATANAIATTLPLPGVTTPQNPAPFNYQRISVDLLFPVSPGTQAVDCSAHFFGRQAN